MATWLFYGEMVLLRWCDEDGPASSTWSMELTQWHEGGEGSFSQAQVIVMRLGCESMF